MLQVHAAHRCVVSPPLHSQLYHLWSSDDLDQLDDIGNPCTPGLGRTHALLSVLKL